MDLQRLCPSCMREAVVGGVCTACHQPVIRSQPPIPNVLPLMSIPDGRILIGRAVGFGNYGITYIALDLRTSARLLLCVTKQQGSRLVHLDALCPLCLHEAVSGGVCSACRKPVPTQQLPPNALPLLSILHGHYLIGRSLGHGGFGITYIALDLRDMHRVAIKEYMPNGVGSRKAGGSSVTQVSPKDFVYGQKHFIQEAQTIYNLNSVPNIIRIEKLFNENNTSYYAMEFLPGNDLKHHLDSHGGRISFQEAARLLLPIIRCLNTVHQKGIIHRDISPDNIFLLDDGSAKLIDFGAAHAALGQKSVSYAVVLKRGYAPVEQYIPGSTQGAPTDIYAMTATLFRCVSGKLPPESIKRLNGQDTLPSIMQGVPATKGQARMLLKGMAVKAEERFQSMNELANAIQAVMGEQSSSVISVTSNGNTYETTLRDGSGNVVAHHTEVHPEQPKLGFFARLFQALFGKKKKEVPAAPATQNVEQSEAAPTTSAAPQDQAYAPDTMAQGQPPAGAYCLRGVKGVFAGKTFALCSDPYRMGRDPDRCDIVFPQKTPGVSSWHCNVWYDFSNECVLVEDNESTYGTLVNGSQKLNPHEPFMLHDGDSFRLLDEEFMVVKM